jgi:HsdM N-terminal domain
VLGLIFLGYAEHRFEAIRPEVEAKATRRRPTSPNDYRARSVLFVPDDARLSTLVKLPEGDNLGKAIDDAMRAIETVNPELRDVRPRGFQRLEKSTLSELLRLFAPLPRKLSGDAFGLIYEDFLSNFAMAEGRLGASSSRRTPSSGSSSRSSSHSTAGSMTPPPARGHVRAVRQVRPAPKLAFRACICMIFVMQGSPSSPRPEPPSPS